MCTLNLSCLTRLTACLLVLGLISFLLSLLGSEILSLDSEGEVHLPAIFDGDAFIDTPGGWLNRNTPVFLPPENENSNTPIILWWTPFTGEQRVERSCGEGSCIFTHSRTEKNNSRTKAFMFYGTDIDWKDLPLPRQDDQFWGLLHEESPKNNWILASEGGISLFNLTATCSRHSSYPITMQYLHKIEWLEQPVSIATQDKSSNGLGLVMYLQSDCNPPSDRDSYVRELMKYISVDSYGKCLHNKDLSHHLLDPLTFNTKEIQEIVSKYKFSLAFENARCHDYITEKFWRPLYAGSVPIVIGSPTIKDWAPTNHSIIVAEDFVSPKELAEYLHFLDSNDQEYEKYLEFKKSGVKNPLLLQFVGKREWVVDYIEPGINFIDGFECFVCDSVYKRARLVSAGENPQPLVANHDHYNCPMPEPALKHGDESVREQLDRMSDRARSELQYWRYISRCSQEKGKALLRTLSSSSAPPQIVQALHDACSTITI